jgi:hypothetical protein
LINSSETVLQRASMFSTGISVPVPLQNNKEIPSAGVPQILKEAPTKRAGVLKVALCQNERGGKEPL